MKPHNLLKDLLMLIEQNLQVPVTVDDLAHMLFISSSQIRRLFLFAFNLPLAGYIRKRKLAVSLEQLQTTDYRINDIAVAFGFGYEQSYIRAFKREYGLTPGEARKSGAIIAIQPPLQLCDHLVQNGSLFGPSIVMVPTFNLVGKQIRVAFAEDRSVAPRLAKAFWDNERGLIDGVIEPSVFYGLTKIPAGNDEWSLYLPAQRVKKPLKIPIGYHCETFPASLCARFRYIGRHHYYDISWDVAERMLDVIMDFEEQPGFNYLSQKHQLFFERIDTADYDGTFCQMEWYTPLVSKDA